MVDQSVSTEHRRQFVRVCECGCGEPTLLARQTKPAIGVVKGQPQRFALGHARRPHPPKPSSPRQFVQICACGCGQPTLLALNSRRCYGYVAGQPRQYLRGHKGAAGAAEALLSRIMARVVKTATCWLWQGRTDRSGYGRIHVMRLGRQAQVHRVVYELLAGPIPPGMEIDHVRANGCTHRNCVNPAHLEAVTPTENTRRGDNLIARNAALTHCHRGHPFDSANTRIDKRGRRVCVACSRSRRRPQAARSGIEDGCTLVNGRCGFCDDASTRQDARPKAAPVTVSRAIDLLLAELVGEEVAAPLSQRFTLASVCADLCRLAGEPVPAAVLDALDGPEAAPVLLRATERRGSFREYREQFYEPA